MNFRPPARRHCRRPAPAIPGRRHSDHLPPVKPLSHWFQPRAPAVALPATIVRSAMPVLVNSGNPGNFQPHSRLSRLMPTPATTGLRPLDQIVAAPPGIPISGHRRQLPVPHPSVARFELRRSKHHPWRQQPRRHRSHRHLPVPDWRSPRRPAPAIMHRMASRPGPVAVQPPPALLPLPDWPGRWHHLATCRWPTPAAIR